MKYILFVIFSVSFVVSSLAQDHGSITLNGKKIPLTGYRTRMNGEKRVIIADGKADNKLYSITITAKPDVSTETVVKADATHSVTVTVSNADYSNAQNFCFDGGSNITITPKDGKFSVTGEGLKPGNCFGKGDGSGNTLSVVVKA